MVTVIRSPQRRSAVMLALEQLEKPVRKPRAPAPAKKRAAKKVKAKRR